MAWESILEVWSLAKPRANGADAVPGAGPFHTVFDLTVFAECENKSAEVRALCQGVPIQPMSEPDLPDDQSGSHKGIQITDVIGFRFRKNSWPGTADLIGAALPLRQPIASQTAPYGPHSKNALYPAGDLPFSAPGYRSYGRLARIAGWEGSMVRLSVEDSGEWWLMFRLPFRAPLVGDAAGRLAAPAEDQLDPRLATGLAELKLGADPAVLEARDLAEARAAGRARTPYFAGVIARPWGRDAGATTGSNPFEALAVNAGALTLQHALAIDPTKLDESPANKGLRPETTSSDGLDDAVLWGRATALVDGFWWAKNSLRFHRDTAKGPNAALASINLGSGKASAVGLQALLADCQDVPGLPGGKTSAPVLAAVASVSPASNDPPADHTPSLAVLDLLGWTAAPTPWPTAKAALAGAVRPDNYLHTRLVTVGGQLTFEWSRWVKVARTVGHGEAVPVLVRVRQGWPDQPAGIDPAAQSAKYTVWLEGLSPGLALDFWSRQVAGRLRAKVTDAFGRKAPNLLPDLDAEALAADASGDWVLRLECEESQAPATLATAQAQPALPVSFLSKATLFQAAPPAQQIPTGEPPKPKPATAPSPVISNGRATFQGLRTTSGPPLALETGDISIDFGEGKSRAFVFTFTGGSLTQVNPHKLSFSTAAARAKPPTTMAIGAFDLTPAVAAAPLAGAGTLLIEITDVTSVEGYQVTTPGPSPAGLRLDQVIVGGADDQDRQIRDQSLIWSKGRFIGACDLVLSDRYAPDQRRRRTLLTIKPAKDAPAHTENSQVTVLDPEPMSVARVKLTTQTGGAAGGDVIAAWNSDEGVWRLPDRDQQGPPSSTLILPPQGLGESWERRKKEEEPKQKKGDSAYLPEDQLIEGQRATAVLTPTASLEIETEERQRNPVAPWNLRRLFTDLDVDLPGARLKKIARLEALYGLEAHDTATPGIRLAELSAWRGVPRDPPQAGDQSQEDIAQRNGRWRKAYRTWRRRLAVLDARADSDPMARPVIEAVDYRLRPEGRYVKPSENLTVHPTWWKAASEGVLGGALAGFEDNNLIKDLLDDAANGRGSIDGLQLSALGAWTKPRATFNNELTLISADVQMGRTQEARFERKGRIGVLRNKAKHVIVYRRAFLPSLQFAADQEYHRGRPVVRKVEEYIELTQPVRSYPDESSATDREAGPVLAARFRTIRIPVHGSWRRPLPGDRPGYAIPLWRQGADPDIYPRPVIELVVAGDPERNEPEPAARRVVNPQDMVFYTLTNGPNFVPDRDTDLWPNVYGVDFADRPIDSPLSSFSPPPRQSDFQAPGDPAVLLPPAPLTPSGMEPFTFRLEPGPAVNLGQGRADKAILADLGSVTLMRARRVAGQVQSDLHKAVAAGQDIEALRQAVQAKIAGLAATIAMGSASATLAELKARAVGAANDQLGRAKDVFKAARDLGPKADLICGWSHSQADAVGKGAYGFIAELKGSLQAAEANWASGRQRLLDSLAAVESRLSSLEPPNAAIVRLIDGPLEAAQTELAALQAEIVKAVDQLDQTGPLKVQLRKLYAPVSKDLREAADALTVAPPSLALARTAVQRLREAARQVADWSADLELAADKATQGLRTAARLVVPLAPPLEAGLRGLIGRIGDVRTTASTGLWDIHRLLLAQAQHADDLVVAAQADLASAADAVASELRAIAGVIDSADTASPKPPFKALLESLGKLSALIASLKADAQAQFKNLNTFLVDARARLITAAGQTDLAKLPTELATAIRAARDKITVDTRPVAELAALSAALQALESVAVGAMAKVTAAVDALCGLATGGADAVQLWMDKAEDQVKQLVKDLDAAVDHSALAQTLDRAAREFDAAAAQWTGGVRSWVDGQAASGAAAVAFANHEAMSILRAAGAPPIVANLAFNREQIGYYFDEARQIVTTPMTALLDQAQVELRGLGAALPTLGLHDTLLPPVGTFFEQFGDPDFKGRLTAIENDIKLRAQDVLKDFAGLKDLLPSLKFDNALARAVKITHDFDAKTRTAWLQADISYQPGDVDIFRLSEFALKAYGASLVGQSRYERSLAGAETRRVEASLSADLAMELGGMALVKIKRAAARYNDRDGMSFDIKPENIEFDGALQAVSRMLAAFSGEDTALKLELILEGGRPVGLRSRYDMPPTTFTAGAFTVFNACLGVHLDLAQKSEFEIRTFAYFGRKAAPFALVITWLGGGGYLEAEALHRPRSGATDVAVSLSLGACAGTGFSFGPLAGSIQVYFGIVASYRSGAGHSRLDIAALIVIHGSVTAWGFVTVGLGVTMLITYEGGRPVGHGHIDIEVRISCFCKKSFSRPIEYRI